MWSARIYTGLALLSLCAGSPVGAFAQASPTPSTAEQIMARVAANQDRAEAERVHFVYLQHAVVQSHKGKTLMCKETTESRITPLPKGQDETLLSLAGEVRSGARVIRYNTQPAKAEADSKPQEHQDKAEGVRVETGDTRIVQDVETARPVAVPDTDIDLVEHLRENLTKDHDGKDGLDAGLFPLTSKQQKEMAFELKGQELKNGFTTFHVVFWPKDKDDFGWKGDAWIDTATLQPVVIRTALSRKIPFAVRALLGTNLPGVGFTAVYAPQPNGIWFPASFGTEFKVHVLFFFERQIVLSVQNHEFERTHVNSLIHAESASTPIGEDGGSQAKQPN